MKRLAPLVALLLVVSLGGCPGNSGHSSGDGHGTSPVNSEADGHDHGKGDGHGHEKHDDHKH